MHLAGRLKPLPFLSCQGPDSVMLTTNLNSTKFKISFTCQTRSHEFVEDQNRDLGWKWEKRRNPREEEEEDHRRADSFHRIPT